MNLDKNVLNAISALPSVLSVSSIDPYGEIIYSTEMETEISSFCSFIVGMNETLEKETQLGAMRKMIVRGPKDNNLLIFKNKQDAILAIETDRKVPISVISKKLETILGVI
jgi:predicted regulator of Ras-like GTPase activity (Roadblock/LC7/MglB family)